MERWRDIPGWFTDDDVLGYRHIVAQLQPNSVVVEVGTFFGKSASSILPLCVNAHHQLICVDKWAYDKADMRKYIPEEYIDKFDWSDLLPYVRQHLHGYERNFTPFRGLSVEAAQVFQRLGVQVDFVFIDADHEYESVRDDIRAWLPVVKTGGWIGGHDYCPGWPGVIRAADEAFTKQAISVKGSVWWVRT